MGEGKGGRFLCLLTLPPTGLSASVLVVTESCRESDRIRFGARDLVIVSNILLHTVRRSLVPIYFPRFATLSF